MGTIFTIYLYDKGLVPRIYEKRAQNKAAVGKQWTNAIASAQSVLRNVSGADSHTRARKSPQPAPQSRWPNFRPASQPEVKETEERGGILPEMQVSRAWPTHGPRPSTSHGAPFLSEDKVET